MNSCSSGWLEEDLGERGGGVVWFAFFYQSKFWQTLNTFRVKVVRKAKIWAEIRDAWELFLYTAYELNRHAPVIRPFRNVQVQD